MNIKTRIKMLAVLLLTAPSSAIRASTERQMQISAGIKDPRLDEPTYILGKYLISASNILLIPLAILTIILYILLKKKSNSRARKKRYFLFFIIFLILLILVFLLKVFLPIGLDYFINNYLLL